MERNLRLYPYYQAARSLFFWIPVFFLYLTSKLNVADALRVEAVYYAAVVALEVPSGMFSDRVGRKVTLLISAAAGIAGYALFAVAGSFELFALAQVLVAVNMSFNSGTDTSLLYDSLRASGDTRALVHEESRALAFGFFAYAVAALVGGAVAGVDLRLAYVLSALGAAVAFGIVLFFREPPRVPQPAADDNGEGAASSKEPSAEGADLKEEPSAVGAEGADPKEEPSAVGAEGADPKEQPSAVKDEPVKPSSSILRLLRSPTLRWTFALSVALTVISHVPYMFFQPYVDLLFGGASSGYQQTPLVAGGLVALMMFLSTGASRAAPRLRERLGAGSSMMLVLLAYVVIVGVMGAVLHPMVLLVIALRGVPLALATPVINSVVHPRVPSERRATYFSVQSLAGRGAFSAALALTACLVGPIDSLSYPQMRAVLLGFAVVAVPVWLALFLFRSRVSEEL
ncbi:MAG: MFS transporter [Myxococcota bacterium]